MSGMGFFNRLFRYLLSVLVMAGVSLGLAYVFLPKGMSPRDLPKTLALIRARTPNPLAQSILDLILSEDIRREAADSRNATSDIGVLDGTVIDPRTLEALEKMNVSLELKKELKRNYLRTGEVPGIRLTATKESEHEPDRAIAAIPIPSRQDRSWAAAASVVAGAASSASRPLPDSGVHEVRNVTA
jgi:hypothetical protein